jgi:hypothetical protein
MSPNNNNGGWVPPAGGPLWPGPDLLVPIAMEAFLIGDGNLASTFAATAPNYASLPMYLQVSVAPFTPVNPSVGVHLHWTLPHGLRHGRNVSGSDSVQFPFVPNRWLLLRVFYPGTATPGTPPQVTPFIILSDQYGTTQADGTVPFPDPNNAYNTVFLGQKVDYAGWTEQAAGTVQWLTATGPGNQAFAATFDSSLNIFSALDTPPEAIGTLSYYLYGWNANYPSDPLFGLTKQDPNGWSTRDQWQALMNDCEWQVADLQSAIDTWQTWRQAHPKVLNAPGQNALNPEQLVLPAQTVLHSTLIGIAWHGTVNQNYPPNLPKTPDLAIGENGNEALSAWLAYKVGGGDPTKTAVVEQLLLSIGQGMSNQLTTDPAKLEDTLHSARFGNQAGGTIWVVQRPQDGSSSADADLGAQDVPLDPNQTKLLTELNEAQEQIEQLNNDIAADQLELFSAYWKSIFVDPFDRKLKQLIADAIQRLSGAITTATGVLNNQAIPTRDDKKKALIAALGSDYVLTTETAPPFCLGNDPVVLVAGASRSTVHDAPGDGDESGLPTRFTGETVTSITVQYTPPGGGNPMPAADVTAQDLVSALTPLSGGLLPKEIPDLLGECLLLDTAAAALIAKLYFGKIGVTPNQQQIQELAATVAKQQSAAWNANLSDALDPQVLANASGLNGVLPDKISVAGWSQPWDPIFMDWKVNWFPTSTDPAHALDGWTLGDIDLEWNSNNSIGTSVGSFAGRAAIGEALSDTFAQQLSDFSKDPAYMSKLPLYEQQLLLDAIALFPASDIVSQSMAGLGAQLIMRGLEIVGPVQNAAIKNLIGAARSEIPVFGTVQDVPPFLPIKSGHFQITDIWLVDAYGQILRGVPAGNAAALPIRSQSVVTDGPNRESYVQMAPRYSGSTRSDFNLVSAQNDQIVTNSSDATNPLAGWVVVNHLDYSLMLFDGTGASSGALTVLDNTSGSGARWDPTPGTQAPFGAAPNFPGSPHLQNFANGVLEVESKGDSALAPLIAIIDATLWQIDSDSLRSNGNLPLLVGTPLALVRATLSLEPRGGPVYDQSWETTNQQNTDGYNKVPLSLRVGDIGFSGNGVVGYFLDDDYTHFYPVHGYSTLTQNFITTLRKNAGNASAALRTLTAAPAAVEQQNPYVVPNALIPLAADGTTRRLTIIMDPRGVVPLISGFLPSKVLALQPGPVNAALSGMAVNFRIGPLLTNPAQVRMPLPSEIRGSWTWIERTGLTLWQETTPAPNVTVASFPDSPPQLTLGWLKLSGAFTDKPN